MNDVPPGLTASPGSWNLVATGETAHLPPADADKIEHQAFHDFDVGELLLEQFGPVYVADVNFDLVHVTEGFKELARDAWGFEVDLAGNAAVPTPLRGDEARFRPSRGCPSRHRGAKRRMSPFSLTGGGRVSNI